MKQTIYTYRLGLRIALSKELINKSFKIALVVGTVLNLINQGDSIIALDFQSLNHFKSFLTYLVPFLVSTYTAVSIKMKFQAGERVDEDMSLQCKHCHSTITLHKNDTIPFCHSCGVKTKWRIKNME